jgi:hypothetical protein
MIYKWGNVLLLGETLIKGHAIRYGNILGYLGIIFQPDMWV